MQASVATLLIVAFMAANLPFLTSRLAGVLPVANKHFGWRLLEMAVLFLLVGLFARFLEAKQMPVQQQHWQFYVTTVALFVVFAFPGFVYQMFWKKRSH
ncbi:DUF2818 family protein [Aquitalea sp. USM4]|uniref:DUF2818 family protein n=1 Tax=Aquitalea sp. USM4 TaxID=1590041 RepID=UPI00103F6E12|nr:DUF2818 family protein [Aquitalea sp. USM4]QBJ77426.1 DUF2818 domain-containing protein [Aquitalea sp. USM4]